MEKAKIIENRMVKRQFEYKARSESSLKGTVKIPLKELLALVVKKSNGDYVLKSKDELKKLGRLSTQLRVKLAKDILVDKTKKYIPIENKIHPVRRTLPKDFRELLTLAENRLKLLSLNNNTNAFRKIEETERRFNHKFTDSECNMIRGLYIRYLRVYERAGRAAARESRVYKELKNYPKVGKFRGIRTDDRTD